MFLALEQTTWDLIAQIGTWIIAAPLLIGGLLAYAAAQIVTERRENQRLEGRWGAKATRRDDVD